MDSNKLSTLEAISVVLTIIIAHIIIYLPQKIISDIGSSSIINVLYVTIIVLILTLIVVKLFKKFDTFDILDVSNYLGGTILSKALIYATTAYGILLAGIFVRYFAESLNILYFPDFKIYQIVLIFLIGSYLVNRYGITNVIRSNFIVLPAIIMSIIIVTVANIPHFTYQRVFPVFGYSLKNTFVNGLENVASFSNFIMIFYLLPFLKNKKAFGKISFVSMLLSSFFILCSVTTLLLVHNFAGEQSVFSIYLTTRSMSFGSFMQRPDSLFILIWILSMFSYLSLIIALTNYIVNKKININGITKKISIKNKIKSKMKNSNNNENTKENKPNKIPLSLPIITFLILIVSLIPKNISQLQFFGNTILQYSLISIGFTVNFIILLLANLKHFIIKKNLKE